MATDHTQTDPPPSPFVELAAMFQQLRDRGLHETVEGSVVEQLTRAAALLEKAHATAAEMQLGAEGFDNTHTAGLYALVQERLLAAVRELVGASAALKAEAELCERWDKHWANLRL